MRHQCFGFKVISNSEKASVGPQTRKEGEPPGSATVCTVVRPLPPQPKPQVPPALNPQKGLAQPKVASSAAECVTVTNQGQLSSNMAQLPAAPGAQEHGAPGEPTA